MKGSLLICDAGPVMIMAKLQVLSRWASVLGHKPVVVQEVVSELKRGPFSFGEEAELRTFLKTVQIVSVPNPGDLGGSLSVADTASLAWALEHSPAQLLADDRLLRRAARHAGVSVVGFPGLLLQATRLKIESPETARRLLDEAIRTHAYRISIALYQNLLQKLGNIQ